MGSFVGRLESSVKQQCLAIMQVLVKMSENRGNEIISENSLFYQCQSVGEFGSFVGQVKTSVKQQCLTIIQVLVKMSENRDN